MSELIVPPGAPVVCAHCKHQAMPYFRGVDVTARCMVTRDNYVYDGMLSFARCADVNKDGRCPKFEAKPLKPPKESRWKLDGVAMSFPEWLCGTLFLRWWLIPLVHWMNKPTKFPPGPVRWDDGPPRPWKQPPPPPKCTCELDETTCAYHVDYMSGFPHNSFIRNEPYQPSAGSGPRSAPPTESGVPRMSPKDKK